ncbi:conserved hypothetical protein [Salmonella enterica subsp. enterica serovar Bovismorbificans str. 3114]|nr:conserved hypothetical protein [Salmonella enterica subsp. enterica serovar Bovismorbificans str. 3114]
MLLYIHDYDLFDFTICEKRWQYSGGQTFCYQFCELASSFFNLIFLSEKDVIMNRNAEKTVIKGLFRLIKIAPMYTMSVF